MKQGYKGTFALEPFTVIGHLGGLCSMRMALRKAERRSSRGIVRQIVPYFPILDMKNSIFFSKYSNISSIVHVFFFYSWLYVWVVGVLSCGLLYRFYLLMLGIREDTYEPEQYPWSQAVR